MNDADLNKRLRNYSLPERPPEYWEDFPRRVMAEAKRERRQQSKTRPAFFPRLAWAGGLALACLIAGFAVGHWHGAHQTETASVLQNEKVIREVLALFPNRVRAIVQNKQGLQLVLSDEADVPASTPIWIKIGGEQGQSVVTFSGQEVQVGGERLTVLSDAKGGIIIVGNRFVWSSDQTTNSSHIPQMQARPLNAIRM